MDEPATGLLDYWNSFYSTRRSSGVSLTPSSFATWVHDRLAPHQPVIEFGFGTARDSLWFSQQGHPVTGYDFAASAVRQAQQRADEGRLQATFFELDLYDASATSLAAKTIAAATTFRPAVYGRFLIHSLKKSGRKHLFDLAATALADGGELYLEFRTDKDRDGEHLFGDDHFRQYLAPARIESELRHRGATILHSEAGHGLAVYKSEDPHVARVVAGWST
jgi:hypothetical protein